MEQGDTIKMIDGSNIVHIARCGSRGLRVRMCGGSIFIKSLKTVPDDTDITCVSCKRKWELFLEENKN